MNKCYRSSGEQFSNRSVFSLDDHEEKVLKVQVYESTECVESEH